MSQLNENAGTVKISEEVIQDITAVAASEVDGVLGICDQKGGLFGIKASAKGVRAEISEGMVDIDVDIVVRFGVKMQEVSMELQSKIKKAVESMTGLLASKINVCVKGIEFPKEENEQ